MLAVRLNGAGREVGGGLRDMSKKPKISRLRFLD